MHFVKRHYIFNHYFVKTRSISKQRSGEDLIDSRMSSESSKTKSPTSEELAWKNVNDLVGRCGDQASVNQFYTEWDDEYERDMAALSYQAPSEAANRVISLVPGKDSRILDFGCGTGLVADLLRDQGYTNLHCVDPVEKLIEKCLKKGKYVSAKVLQTEPITKIPFENDYFEAVVSSGCFGKGGAGRDISPFTEIVRVLRPGGSFINVTRKTNYEYRRQHELNLKETYEKLSKEGVWTITSTDICTYYKTSPPLPAIALVVKKN